MRKKAAERIHIIRRASGTVWGMESRILAVSTHALVESVANSGLATTGGRGGKMALRKTDTAIMNVVAREVVGANMSARKEILYALADVKTAYNHYIFKGANMLDRILRATNTAAQKTALEITKKAYPRAETGGKKKFLHAWTEITSLRGKESNLTENQQIEQEERPSRHQKYWEVTTNWWETRIIHNTQKSILHANEETATLPSEKPELTFQDDNTLTAYERAMTILQSIGWRPMVTFDKTLFPQHENQILWPKIKWVSEGALKTKTMKNETRSRIIVHPVQTAGLVVGTTKIIREDESTKEWHHVIGEKINENPACIEGINLMLSAHRFVEDLEQRQGNKPTALPENHVIEPYSGYLMSIYLHPTDKMRWQQYGAPGNPLPEHKEHYELLAKITHAGSLKFLEVREVAKQQRNELRMTPQKEEKLKTNVGRLMGTEHRLPVFWMTQEEIKALLKNKQELGEQKVIHQLAESATAESISSRIYTEWALTREAIREVLNHLSYDRMLQVTSGNVVGATRFKILRGTNLSEVARPKCGEKDSWEHCKECYGFQAPAHNDNKEWLRAVDVIMNQLRTPNPAMNTWIGEKK